MAVELTISSVSEHPAVAEAEAALARVKGLQAEAERAVTAHLAERAESQRRDYRSERAAALLAGGEPDELAELRPDDALVRLYKRRRDLETAVSMGRRALDEARAQAVAAAQDKIRAAHAPHVAAIARAAAALVAAMKAESTFRAAIGALGFPEHTVPSGAFATHSVSVDGASAALRVWAVAQAERGLLTDTEVKEISVGALEILQRQRRERDEVLAKKAAEAARKAAPRRLVGSHFWSRRAAIEAADDERRPS